ncbi:hypothetical protein OKW34_002259 [Paraburkholderia youngii]
MWLTGRLAPDFKTIADFRHDNGAAIRNVCRRFVELCRGLKLLSSDMVAIDGSRFKAVNSRDKNYTTGKIDKRLQQIEESVQRYLDAIETADRTSPTGFAVKTVRLYEKIASLRREMRELTQIKRQLQKQPDKQLSMTDPDARSMATSGRGSGIVGYNVQVAGGHEAPPDRCTRSDQRWKRSRATRQDGGVREEGDGHAKAEGAG